VRRIEPAQAGNLGDVGALGEGLSEMRIHYGPGYRLHLAQRGERLVLLLCGGDKSSQAGDIREARAMAKELDNDA
jgi:putative addiction module killer protein